MNAIKFRPGRIVSTPGALGVMQDAGVNPLALLRRHLYGDWGDVCADDQQSNDAAVSGGERVLSSYAVGAEKVWVITERDRSVTTFLLPEEY